jgi:hypothetical protein
MPNCYTCGRDEVTLFINGEAFHPVLLENRQTHEEVNAVVCKRCLNKMEGRKK